MSVHRCPVSHQAMYSPVIKASRPVIRLQATTPVTRAYDSGKSRQQQQQQQQQQQLKQQEEEDGASPSTVPVINGEKSFHDLQRNMEEELERKRREWEMEVRKMQDEFFGLRADDHVDSGKGKVKEKRIRVQTSGGPAVNIEVTDPSVYRVKFDLKGYSMDNIDVKLEGDKMSVSATKEEKRGNTTTVKQFNRHVDLPHGIDHDLLESYLFPDGTLTIEAPLDTSLTSVHSSGTYSTTSDLHHNNNNNNNHRYNNGHHNGDDEENEYNYRYEHHHSNGGSSGEHSPTSEENQVFREYHITSSRSVEPPLASNFRFTHLDHGLEPLSTSTSRIVVESPTSPLTPTSYYSSSSSSSLHSPRPRMHRSGYRIISTGVHSPPISPPSYSSVTSNELTNGGTKGVRGQTTAILSTGSGNATTSTVDTDYGRKWLMTVDIGPSYSVSDVNVTLQTASHTVSVQAKREISLGTHVRRSEFSRQFDVDADIEATSLRAALGKDGMLYLGASCSSNDDHDTVRDAVLLEMPAHAQLVKVAVSYH